MTSKLIQMQSRFQQKQMQEREEKLLKLYENQQQRAFDRVGRGSAGSNTSVGSNGGGGKVRQMFDERRQKAGVDRSYPLEPLKTKSNGTRGGSVDRNNTNTRNVKSTVQSSSYSAVRNGNPVVNKREVVKSVYTNNNGKESFERQVYEENDPYNSKSHRELMDMMNKHNIEEGLDYEMMPKLELDDIDNNFNHHNNNVSEHKLVKKAEGVKSSTRANNGVVKKDNDAYSKKVVTSSSPSPSKTSPRGTSLSSVAKTTPKPAPKVTSSEVSSKMSRPKPAGPSTSRPTKPSATRSGGVVRDDLAECSYCNRRFASDRIQKHEEICAKTGKKKRKAYDATKHRVIGTELESYVLKGGGGTKSKGIATKLSRAAPKKDWRKAHEDFISAIRAAKEAQAHVARGGKLSDLPPPPPSSNPDYVQCPHCGRRFNQAAAERHIPKCASYQFNKPKPPAPGKRK